MKFTKLQSRMRHAHDVPVTALSLTSHHRGFTLIELLLVIGIIAILASVVIVAINPTKQLADGRNAHRRSNVATILNAVYQYSIDHNGVLPGDNAIPTTTFKDICIQGSAVATCATNRGVSLKMLTSTGTYLTAIPADPQATTYTSTGTLYGISIDGNSRVTIQAMRPERGATISVSR